MDLRADVARFVQNPAARRDPRALYDRLVRHAPVISFDDANRMWLVSGYDEILVAARSPHAISDFTSVGAPIDRVLNNVDVISKMLPMRTGADHARLRRLANNAFSARTVASIRAGLAKTVTDLIGPHLAAGTLDVVADLARPLPVAISCMLLDIPIADRARVALWAQQFVASLAVQQTAEQQTAEQQPTERANPHQSGAFDEMRDYIRQLCAQRALRPGADLISHLVSARRDGIIDNDELFAFVLMLFVNGLDTLTSGLSVAVWHLIQQREFLDRVGDDSDLAEAVFDECQRLGGAVRASARILTADLSLGNHTLPRGSGMILLFAAANRDPRRFPDPDRLDPSRAERHLAFGHGPHHCLGASLSLAVGGTVLSALARNCGNLRTPHTQHTAPWQTSMAVAGLDSLPITFVATRTATATAAAEHPTKHAEPVPA